MNLYEIASLVWSLLNGVVMGYVVAKMEGDHRLRNFCTVVLLYMSVIAVTLFNTKFL